MKLEDYARSGKYLKWQDTDVHHIGLNMEFEEFKKIEPVLSERHGSDQYEIPVIVKDVDQDLYESILATKSKDLLIKLLNEWENSPTVLLRLNKQGTGFYTKWTVERVPFRYDKASGEVKRLPAKKK